MVESVGRVAGVSSFGMSGVNAHGLFVAPSEGRCSHGAEEPLLWHSVRHWPLAMRHNLLLSVSAGGGVCRSAKFAAQSGLTASCYAIY